MEKMLHKHLIKTGRACISCKSVGVIMGNVA